MKPNTFLKYQGGSDVVYELIVVDKIKGDNFEEAAKQYRLDENNYRALSPKASKRPDNFRRFIWWR
ncbi:hypothetical protein [Denitrovibrio acetiphilus]|uniref:hypothetical protein n=1 Tax=Denitrovibrio acetiphilus TaxID=118000 RepID=UPI00030FF7A1|nr:hypothetical protein [Denitrovibrio acetiphilus]